LFFCLPFTKLRHFLIAPINLCFRNLGQRGRLTPIEDFESAETFGVSQIEQYTWNQLGGTQIYDGKGIGYKLDQTDDPNHRRSQGDPGPVPGGRPMVFSARGRTASHFDSRRRRLHRRRVP